MKHRIAAVALAASLAAPFTLAACSDSEVSADDARRIVLSGLLDAGQPADVAACIAERALERHSPGQLVNPSGTTSDAVNASVARIAADCARELAPHTVAPATTTSTVAPTTVPAITVPEAFEPAVCDAGYDVVTALDAIGLVDAPGPGALEGWLEETDRRVGLALLTAPDGQLRDLYRDLREAVEQRGGAVLADPLVVALAEALDAGGCSAPTDDAAARALAADLALLDAPPPTTVPLPDVSVNHAPSGIVLDVPSGWTGQTGGVAATPFGAVTRFVVRSPDPAVFAAGRFDGAGAAIYAVDGTVDFPSMLNASGPAQSCTVARETAYDDGVYVGVRREYSECAGETRSIVVVGAADNAARVAVYVEIRATSLDDRAIAVVLNSFYV